jgi:hypothetical protein
METRLMLPSTSAACVLLLDPERRNILFNQFAYPSLKVQAVNNRATDKPVIQNTAAAQPVWLANAVQGTYSWRNNPSTPTPAQLPPGKAGLVFAGAAYLEYDSVASFANNEANVSVVAVVDGLTSGDVFAFGGAGATPALSLSVSAGTLSLTEVNSNGTFTASHAIDGYAHVVTASRINGSLFLRIDGAQVATHAVTGASESFTTFVVGASNFSGAVGNKLTGTLGPVAVYSGGPQGADVYQVETYLLVRFGVIRGASQGKESGF